MNRLEVINAMQTEEERKVYFEKVLNDLKSSYLRKSFISVEVDSGDYNKKHENGGCVKVDVTLFKAYLQLEINRCDNEIAELINKL